MYEAEVIDSAVDEYLRERGVSQAPGFAIKRLCRDMYRFVRGFGIWSMASSAEAAEAAGQMMLEWKLGNSLWLSDPACYGALRVAVAAIQRLHPGLPLRQAGWQAEHISDAWCVCEQCRQKAKAALPHLLLRQEERDSLSGETDANEQPKLGHIMRKTA